MGNTTEFINSTCHLITGCGRDLQTKEIGFAYGKVDLVGEGQSTCGAPWVGYYNGTDKYGQTIAHEKRIFVRFNDDEIVSYSDDDLETRIPEYWNMLGDRPLVVGGHYMPHLITPDIMPKYPFEQLKTSLLNIKTMKNAGKNPTLLLYINDIHMSLRERKELYEDYRFPKNAYNEINRYKNEVGEFDIYVVSEAKLMNFVGRKKKKLKKETLNLHGIPIYEANKGWLDKEILRVYKSMVVPTEQQTNKCAIATAGVISLMKSLGSTGLLIYIPVCGFNGEVGMRIGEAMFGSHIPRITIMNVESCY